MNKTARTFLTLLLAVCLLPACTRKQAPSQYGNQTGTGNSGLNGTSDYGGDYIPEGSFDLSLDDSANGGLIAREGNGIENGMYEGFTMVEGVLPSVYFDFDSSSVAASERAKLQQAADYLQQNSGYHILIEGHCDWYGTSEYNLALGDRRASSISDYLGTLGITPLRVEKLSKGSLEATSGLSKSQSSQDRRADLILLKK
ncbi:OmpA family protein [Coraliomargarita sp. SDUM461004]|uniref:OmpA family protein n=2 Tax=Thalassobacterium sedimentorum TaxID=3041258 RepID=A0ABU1AMR5_9BACT|nr:OmpA family protein [Coraliomargarita sp. SDUM461004]